MPLLPPLLPETILKDRYQIIETVGQGGMGSVYQSDDLRLDGRQCAIKEIHVDPSLTSTQQSQARDQFYREASILARLDHPNLPKVSDFFNERDRDFLVMDYVSGVDLRQLIADSKRQNKFLPERKVLDWVDQLCDALEYLHSLETPVLHRDIKPANIKLTPQNRIKLVDFGLVKIMTPDDESTITVVQGRGTAIYSPLEQYGGDDGHTDSRTDIYALGATMFHLLTGQQPPEAKARFLNPTALKPPRELNPDITLRTEHAILWALEMHPDHRPRSVSAFREVLFSTGPLPGITSRKSGITFHDIAPVNRALATVILGLLALSALVTLFPRLVFSP